KAIVSLLFNHALTAIQFKTGSQLPSGITIKSISFKNIYFKGEHFIGAREDDAWKVDQTQKRDFTLNLNYSSDGTAGKDITTPDNTFFLLPQVLPSDAVLEVTMMINGQLKTLKKAINGKTWKQGEKIVYNLSSSKITQETFTLEAVATGTANYNGTGNISYTVKSTKKDGFGHVSFAPWTMEFSTDNGAHWTNTKPDFITLTTQENNGDLTAKSYTATFAAQEKTIGGTSADILKAREILNDVDLSHRDIHGNTHSNGQTTANCYVIHNPGTYKFPAIYGNAMKNGADNKSAYKSTKNGWNILSPFINAYGQGITKPQIDNINNACLIWQDTQNLISNISYTADGYVHFSVDKATIHNGNAIIAVRDDSNTILWSWHIWVTEEDLTPVEVTNYQGIKYNFMPINLGWCGLNNDYYNKREVLVKIKQTEGNKVQEVILRQRKFELSHRDGNCTFYQWGRKDPMLPGNGIGDADKTCYTTDDRYQFAYQGHGVPLNTTDIKEYIRNPHKFNIYNYMDNKYYNLWSTDNARTDGNDDVVIKSVYDPSPVGYSLPASNAFTGFTTTGQNTSNPAEFNVKGNFNKGWLFYCKPNKQVDTVFFPACGSRHSTTGSLGYVTTGGFCYVAGPYDGGSGHFLSFISGYVGPLHEYYRSYGFAVRCAKEK
ncbi:MAG: fimbrillin family protein, partial [Candidatus Cryptobacteroides sp.]